MSYKVWYFKFRGRGEQVRLLLSALGAEYEDCFVDRAGFMGMKKEGPARLAFGSLPMLEDGDLRLVQGPAIMGYVARKEGGIPEDLAQAARADAICLGAEDLRMIYFKVQGEGKEEAQKEFLEGPWKQRWLPNLEGLLELNGSDQHFVGDRLTHADAAVWDVLNAMVTYVPGASLEGFSRVEGFYKAFSERDAVAAYLKSDRRLP